MSDGNTAVRWTVGVLLLALAGGGAVYLARQGPPPRPVAPAATPAPTPEAVPSPAIQHPIEAAVSDEPAVEPTPAEPLPALGDSDAPLLAALAELVDAGLLNELVVPQYLIQRTVATIDNLPRRKLTPNLLPTRPVAGRFVVADAAGELALSQDNAARYADYVRVIDALDAKKLVALYVRMYPLFQQAYRELGDPNAYFNDRLVEVIDHLLAAPAAPPDVRLVRPKVFYEFADPELESLSAGHKLMIRIGPEQAAIVKAKLRQIRAELTGSPPPTG